MTMVRIPYGRVDIKEWLDGLEINKIIDKNRSEK